MSKMDALRAMREARYEQAAARSTKAAPKRPTALPPTAVSVPAEAQPAVGVMRVP